jgi:mono/diheme cytochrome c family protein
MRTPKHICSLTIATSALLLTAALLTSCKTTPYEYSVTPYEYSGVRLYQVFCSSCHGLTGRGDGPVEPLFRGGVPDLAHLAARHGREFPADQVRMAIDGRETFIAHGTRGMPVWGFEFYDGSPDAQSARRRSDQMIDRIVRYIGEMQVD